MYGAAPLSPFGYPSAEYPPPSTGLAPYQPGSPYPLNQPTMPPMLYQTPPPFMAQSESAPTPVQYPLTQYGSLHPMDPLDAYHQNLLGYSSIPLEFRYTGPPARVPKIRPGFGWYANAPTTFRYVPGEQVIYDQRGVPVLKVSHLTSGYLLYGLTGELLGKSEGVKGVWNIEAPSGRLTLRSTAYEVTLESNIKSVPFATSTSILLKANWGALLPPLQECFVILNTTGEDIAVIRNESGVSVHQSYSITIKPEHDALILLVLLCHVGDFVLQHCANIDKKTRGNLAVDQRSLDRLYKSLGKWGAEPPPAAICTPALTMRGFGYSLPNTTNLPYTGASAGFVPTSSGYISQPDRW